MPSATLPIELRFEWSGGRAVFLLTQEEALKAAVAMRRLGLGLTFQRGQAMVTTETAKFVAAERLLQSEVRRRR